MSHTTFASQKLYYRENHFLYSSVSYKQHPEFRTIQIDSRACGWLDKKMTRSSTIYKLTDEAYNQEPSKLKDHIPSRCFLGPPTLHFFPSIYLGRKMGYLLHMWIYWPFFFVFYTWPNIRFSFPWTLSFLSLIHFFENLWLRTWMDLRVHACTCALISRHRPTSSPFHTQTLLWLQIPGRRDLDWTSIVPWPANSIVTSTI